MKGKGLIVDEYSGSTLIAVVGVVLSLVLFLDSFFFYFLSALQIECDYEW